MQEIVTPEEMAAVDAAASEPVDVLIGRAGAAVARTALDLMGGAYGRRVVVVAGKGNNGADGRAGADRLRARGVRCTVIDAADPPATLPEADLVIDAAYGTGFRGTWDPPALPSPRTPVLAVDIPSGVDGLTGEVSGRPWCATATVTFAAWKPGLLLGAGAALAGAVTVADIGLDPSGGQAGLVEATDVTSWLPRRPRATHKWKAAVWVVAGSPGMTGAAHLAVGGAQRAGAGYVRLSTPGSDQDTGAPTEAVVTALDASGWADQILEGAGRFGAIALGPGLGTDERTAQEIRSVLARASVPLVVDSDGLRALADGRDDLLGPDRTGPPMVLTPHNGEFEALTGAPPGVDRFSAVRELAAHLGVVVLLKGPTTLVADPTGPVWATTTGDARLATAGTGDVLTGVIAALLAQGIDAPQAAAAGAWLHGRAGALAWRHGLVATDVIHHLPAAFTEHSGA